MPPVMLSAAAPPVKVRAPEPAVAVTATALPLSKNVTAPDDADALKVAT